MTEKEWCLECAGTGHGQNCRCASAVGWICGCCERCAGEGFVTLKAVKSQEIVLTDAAQVQGATPLNTGTVADGCHQKELADLRSQLSAVEAKLAISEAKPSVEICRQERAEGNGGCGACALCCKELRDRFDDEQAKRLAVEKELQSQAEKLEGLKADCEFVVSRFEKDEAQGYRSRDRQFAIEMLRRRLAALLTEGLTPGAEREEKKGNL